MRRLLVLLQLIFFLTSLHVVVRAEIPCSPPPNVSRLPLRLRDRALALWTTALEASLFFGDDDDVTDDETPPPGSSTPIGSSSTQQSSTPGSTTSPPVSSTSTTSSYFHPSSRRPPATPRTTYFYKTSPSPWSPTRPMTSLPMTSFSKNTSHYSTASRITPLTTLARAFISSGSASSSSSTTTRITTQHVVTPSGYSATWSHEGTPAVMVTGGSRHATPQNGYGDELILPEEEEERSSSYSTEPPTTTFRPHPSAYFTAATAKGRYQTRPSSAAAATFPTTRMSTTRPWTSSMMAAAETSTTTRSPYHFTTTTTTHPPPPSPSIDCGELLRQTQLLLQEMTGDEWAAFRGLPPVTGRAPAPKRPLLPPPPHKRPSAPEAPPPPPTPRRLLPPPQPRPLAVEPRKRCPSLAIISSLPPAIQARIMAIWQRSAPNASCEQLQQKTRQILLNLPPSLRRLLRPPAYACQQPHFISRLEQQLQAQLRAVWRGYRPGTPCRERVSEQLRLLSSNDISIESFNRPSFIELQLLGGPLEGRRRRVYRRVYKTRASSRVR